MTAVMTEHHAEADYDAPDTYSGPVCRSCGGPCWFWKGSVWEYTCTGCLNRYLDEAAARGAERDRKERERLARKAFRNDVRASVTANGQRQEGGGSALCAAPSSGADRDREWAAAPRFVPRRSDDHQYT